MNSSWNLLEFLLPASGISFIPFDLDDLVPPHYSHLWAEVLQVIFHHRGKSYAADSNCWKKRNPADSRTITARPGSGVCVVWTKLNWRNVQTYRLSPPPKSGGKRGGGQQFGPELFMSNTRVVKVVVMKLVLKEGPPDSVEQPLHRLQKSPPVRQEVTQRAEPPSQMCTLERKRPRVWFFTKNN